MRGSFVLTCAHAIKYFVGEVGKWGRCWKCKAVVMVRAHGSGSVQRVGDTEKYAAMKIELPPEPPVEARREVVEWAMRLNRMTPEKSQSPAPVSLPLRVSLNIETDADNMMKVLDAVRKVLK